MPLVVLIGLVSYLLLTKGSGASSTVAAAQAASAQEVAQTTPLLPIEPPNQRALAQSGDQSTLLGPGGSQTPLGAVASTTEPAWDIGSKLTDAANANEQIGTMAPPTVQGPLRWDPMSRGWY